MIDTPRLLLRAWRETDRAPWAELVADPEVMRFLGPPRDRAAADDEIDRAIAHQKCHGFTFWAIERREDGAFLGFCGLKRVIDASPILGAVEIGWRLRRDSWGSGYAREAAQATLAWAFGDAGLDRVVAMTVAANTRSWGLMERLGMTRRPDLDFDHPRLAADDPLRRHIVYDIIAPAEGETGSSPD